MALTSGFSVLACALLRRKLGVMVCVGVGACSLSSLDELKGKGADSGATGGSDAGLDANTGGLAGNGGLAGSGGQAGFGGTAGIVGAAGGVTGVDAGNCDLAGCKDYDLGSGFTMPRCCAGSDCGSMVTPTIANVMNVPVGCRRHNAPGNLDSECPDVAVPSSATVFKGCCRSGGVCGVVVDLSSINGLNLGCTLSDSVKTCSPSR